MLLNSVLVLGAAVAPPGPTFLGAVLGIGCDGSPWQYMLRLRNQYPDCGVTKVGLGPAGDFYFLLSAKAVKQVCLDDAESFPRRFSVPLFKTLSLDRGIVYEQGARHKRQKRVCIPAFEQSRSMASYLKAVQQETMAVADAWRERAAARDGSLAGLDLYSEMRRHIPFQLLLPTCPLPNPTHLPLARLTRSSPPAGPSPFVWCSGSPSVWAMVPARSLAPRSYP